MSDGGLSTTVSLSVNVLAATTDDLMGPRVRLRSPAVAPKASSVTAEALVEDTSAIASVEFLIGTQVALTLTEAPYTYTFQTLAAAGPIMPLSVRATDAAGNQTTVSAPLTIIEAHSTELPALESLRAPAQLIAGTSVLLGVNASSASGIDSVTFLKDGAVLASANAEPFGAAIAIRTIPLGAWPLTSRSGILLAILTQVETPTVVASVSATDEPEPTVFTWTSAAKSAGTLRGQRIGSCTRHRQCGGRGSR